MSVPRRLFLQGAGSALALAAAKRAHAAYGLSDRTADGKTYNVLEIHFAGGLNHRETFWVERPDEAPVKRALHDFDLVADPIVNPSGADGLWVSYLAGTNAYE